MTTLNNHMKLAILKRKKGHNPLKNGFTMIELMVVVAIVGVLSAVALPQFSKAQDRAKISAATQEAVNFAKECSIHLLAQADAPDPANYDTIATAQTCAAGVDVIATATDADSTAITVTLDGDIPTAPVEG